MHAASNILLLLFVTTLCGPLARVVRIPMPLVQIGLGAAASLLGMTARIEADVFMLLFIPPLLFSDAFLMPMREFREMHGVILGLAVGLVLFATAGGGLLVHWLIPPLLVAVCFALAAVLSPTDAVAVSSMLEGRGAPRRLLHVLAGEALLNDATGLVCFRFATAAAMSGSFSFLHATGAFVVVSVVGAAVGIGTALALNLATRMLMRGGFEHGPTYFTTTALLPFAAYMSAEHLGASGILAAVAAGLTFRRSGVYTMMGTETRLGSSAIWGMLIFLLNGMVFVMLGLQLPAIVSGGIALMHRVQLPVWRLPLSAIEITLGLVALRLLWLSGSIVLGRLLRKRSEATPSPSRPTAPLVLAMSVAGVRGAITLAAVLSLENGFPARDLLVSLATGVILCSLLLAAIALPLLLAGESANAVDPHEQETDRARLAMATAAATAVQDALTDADDEHRPMVEGLLRELRFKEQRLQLAAEDAPEDERDQQLAAFHRHRTETAIRLRAIRAERKALAGMTREGSINDDIERALIRELDHQEEVVLATARALPRSLPRDHAGHPEHEAQRETGTASVPDATPQTIPEIVAGTGTGGSGTGGGSGVA